MEVVRVWEEMPIGGRRGQSHGGATVAGALTAQCVEALVPVAADEGEKNIMRAEPLTRSDTKCRNQPTGLWRVEAEQHDCERERENK